MSDRTDVPGPAVRETGVPPAEKATPDPGSPDLRAAAADTGTAGGPTPDGPVHLPRGERPETGDEAVETALDGLDAADGSDLDAHIEAAEAVHRALQQRLSDVHG